MAVVRSENSGFKSSVGRAQSEMLSIGGSQKDFSDLKSRATNTCYHIVDLMKGLISVNQEMRSIGKSVAKFQSDI